MYFWRKIFDMLGLKLTTDPRWVNIVETNIEEILTDHAWCEQKAASNAIYIIVNNSEKEDLVTEMLKISREELEHFAIFKFHVPKKSSVEFC